MKSSDPVTKIPGVGEVQAKKYKKLEIETVEQLLEFLPRDILDLSDPTPIGKITARFGEKIVLRARVENISLIKTPRKHIFLVQAMLRDDTGEVAVHWFNQPYLRNFFRPDKKYILYGELNFDFISRKAAISNPEIFQIPGLFPLYRQTGGLSSKQISRTIKTALDKGYMLPDLIPGFHNSQIIPQIHLPSSINEYKEARRDFILQKLIIFVLANLYLKKESERSPTFKINIDRLQIENFIKSLPFELTNDQNKTVEDILDNFAKSHPMNRLIQGDVGSGKTVVALIAALAVIKSGFRVAWLAPTQILAAQHEKTASKLLEYFDISISLVTSATVRREIKSGKLKVKNTIQNLEKMADLFIGTHALLNQKIKDLGLVIVDEQQRFGVEQRADLVDKHSKNKNKIPHLLSLSATPIPRTLAHVIFGNLDISTIETKPVGRKKIKTYLVPENKRRDSYEFIDRLVEKGQQIFVICPLIEDLVRSGTKRRSDSLFDDKSFNERKTVLSELKKLRLGPLAHRRIAALHGKMKQEEKEKIMFKMHRGEIDILISTSVVEVGVDIPQATVMLIEDAECFGLSQLHQFRGRVGRNNLQSYCLLFSDALENEKTLARLKAFVQNDDGFKLAQMDLRQRGPGAILGLRQSGFGLLNPIWFENSKILETASVKAKKLLLELDQLSRLKEKVLAELETKHLE